MNCPVCGQSWPEQLQVGEPVNCTCGRTMMLVDLGQFQGEAGEVIREALEASAATLRQVARERWGR